MYVLKIEYSKAHKYLDCDKKCCIILPLYTTTMDLGKKKINQDTTDLQLSCMTFHRHMAYTVKELKLFYNNFSKHNGSF